jgi:hypothetical protein
MTTKTRTTKPSRTKNRKPKASTPKAKPGTKVKTEPGAAQPEPKARATRTDTKQAKLIAMLKATKGATIEEIAKAFDWQPHTVRGALAGALKKRLGLDVTSEKVEGRGRVYRLAD